MAWQRACKVLVGYHTDLGKRAKAKPRKAISIGPEDKGHKPTEKREPFWGSYLKDHTQDYIISCYNLWKPPHKVRHLPQRLRASGTVAAGPAARGGCLCEFFRAPAPPSLPPPCPRTLTRVSSCVVWCFGTYGEGL